MSLNINKFSDEKVLSNCPSEQLKDPTGPLVFFIFCIFTVVIVSRSGKNSSLFGTLSTAFTTYDEIKISKISF